MIYRRRTDVLTMWSACTRARMLLDILSISAERVGYAWKFNIADIMCNNSFFNDHVISSAYWMSHVKFLCMVITIWDWSCGGDRCDDDGRHVSVCVKFLLMRYTICVGITTPMEIISSWYYAFLTLFQCIRAICKRLQLPCDVFLLHFKFALLFFFTNMHRCV